MIKLHLTNKHGGRPLHMYLAGNFTVYSIPDARESRADKITTVIMDGLHNNGGWHVEESIEEVNRMINEQLD
tara:strand:+ start:362 stop:577 length:216 start_codon:yes stop_codon:yes gene_type:complete